MNTETFPDLLNHTFTDVYNKDDNDLVFVRQDGKVFRFTHFQDCCESVSIEDICGDLKDLVGSPLLIAEGCENESVEVGNYGDSGTWTFYKFSAINGSVTVRWYGESNGYYSESVSFEECNRPQDWIRN
jgi:hypothetical protein